MAKDDVTTAVDQLIQRGISLCLEYDPATSCKWVKQALIDEDISHLLWDILLPLQRMMQQRNDGKEVAPQPGTAVPQACNQHEYP